MSGCPDVELLIGCSGVWTRTRTNGSKARWAANYPTPDCPPSCRRQQTRFTIPIEGLGGRLGTRRRNCLRHNSVAPAFNPLVQVSATQDFYRQAAAVRLADVQSDCLRVVPFDARPTELCWVSVRHLEPEVLSCG